jgi:uncharacterized membrane protein YesL
MNFFNMDGPIYKFLDRFTDLFFLNILWIIFSLPLITIFPATSALFGVVRRWVEGKDVKVASSFISLFRENFKQSFLISIIWIPVTIILISNFNLVTSMPNEWRVVFIPLLGIFTILLSATTIYLFPCIVHFDINLKGVIRNAFYLSITNLGKTLLCMLIVTLAVSITYLFSFALLFIFSVAAYIIYYLCNKSFLRLRQAIQNH